MSEALFRDDAYRRETEASVVRAGASGIVLDRTVFYPRGGGQAGDAGVLRTPDGREIAIADTVKGVPSWNFTFGRRLKRVVVGFSDSHDRARHGSTLRSLPRVTSGS